MGKMPFIAQLRASAEAAKNFAAGLFVLASGAVLELEETKADKGEATPITIKASDWKLPEGQETPATSEEYPYYLDIKVEGVTALDRATVTVAVEALSEAVKCGLCPTCETSDGKIRLWSASKPTADMAAEYWIEQGANPSQEEGKE